MACPTCDHTMQLVAVLLFWCPRCGTLKQEAGTTEVPALVKRLRHLDHVADKADIVDMLLLGR